MLTPNNRMSKDMTRNLTLKGEMDKSTIIVGDLNILLLVTGGKNEQKITDSLEDLINTNTQPDLIDIDRNRQQQYTHSF